MLNLNIKINQTGRSMMDFLKLIRRPLDLALLGAVTMYGNCTQKIGVTLKVI